jgi:pimeloyl-ACP methyl ester carboxylesterase
MPRLVPGLSTSLKFLLLAVTCVAYATARPAADSYALLDGARVHYENYGGGATAVVFVHGWACDCSFWHSQVSEFAKKWRVIVLDLPGHGKSDHPRLTYTPTYLARGIDAVLTHAGVMRVFIVAHSVGVLVARHYVDAHPENVAALVNVDSRSLFYGEPDDAGQPERLARSRAIQGPEAAVVWRQRIERFFTSQTPDAVRKEVHEKMPHTDAFVAASALANLNQTKPWSQNPTFVPTLAIYADQVPANNETRLRQAFPNLQYEFWPKAGHFIMLEQPESFNRLVMAFIKARAQASTGKRDHR